LENDNHEKGGFGPFLISFEDLKNHLLVPDIKESELKKNIRIISENFTQTRSEIGKYVLDEKLVSTYASFYLPTNIPKLKFLFDQLTTEIKNDIFKREFIDMGSGPGTFAYAFRSLRASNGAPIFCIDSSALMLAQSKKILNGFFPKQEVIFQKNYLTKNKESVLFFGNSINEMGKNLTMSTIEAISPEYIIWIEPGTSELFKDIKTIRAQLVADYDIIYPCLSGAACPNQWCHQVLRTTFHPSIERLSQLVELNRKTLPLVAHVYRKKTKEQYSINVEEIDTAVIVQYLNETKFSFLYEVCISDNGENKMITFELLKKFMTNERVKYFKNSNVGERVKFQVEKKLEKVWRVKLI
jgi:ribosomal protein RSM22 (predicted rRNA methylase)